MNDRCPACGGIRVPFGEVYVGDGIVCQCAIRNVFGTSFIDVFSKSVSTGWICAKCGASYAPWVYRCEPCSQPKTYTASSTKATL